MTNDEIRVVVGFSWFSTSVIPECVTECGVNPIVRSDTAEESVGNEKANPLLTLQPFSTPA